MKYILQYTVRHSSLDLQAVDSAQQCIVSVVFQEKRQYSAILLPAAHLIAYSRRQQVILFWPVVQDNFFSESATVRLLHTIKGGQALSGVPLI